MITRSDVLALGGSVGKLTGLQHLQMSFEYCEQLSVVSCWGPSLVSLKTIATFMFSFCGCVGLPDDIAQQFVSISPMAEVMASISGRCTFSNFLL